MKKSSFTAMILGTVSGILFALGMCMVLLPEWNAFRLGIICGGIGIVLGVFTFLVWRKMEHKQPIQISGKMFLRISVGVLGMLIFGTGMCFCMVWNRLGLGIVIGLVGIVVLLSLIPMTKGIR